MTLWFCLSSLIRPRIVSATLDRPFGLNGDDVLLSVYGSFCIYRRLLTPDQISPEPPSRDSRVGGDDAAVRHMVAYSQLLRSIRSAKDPETGILCYFINVRHWKETSPKLDSRMSFHYHTLLARAYVELCKQPLFLIDPDRTSIIDEVFQDFSHYLDAVEEKLVSGLGAVPSLDAILIFSIGVIIATSTPGHANNASDLFKVSNALALLSSRYAAVRSLRDVMLELQQTGPLRQSQGKLRALVVKSEIVVSDKLQLLMLGDGSNHRALDR